MTVETPKHTSGSWRCAAGPSCSGRALSLRMPTLVGNWGEESICQTQIHRSQSSFLGKHVGVRSQQEPHKEARLQV